MNAHLEWRLKRVEKIVEMDSWLNKAKERDTNAINSLYSELKRPIFVLALSIVQDYYLAEDILQDTFIKVMNECDKYSGGSNAKAWIMTIARNLSLNYLKKHKREELKDEMVYEDRGTFTEEVESTMEFFRLIDPLDGDEKQIVALKIMANLKHKDIARMLDLSVSNVRAKYSRAIKKLKNN